MIYAFEAASGSVAWTYDVSQDGATQFHGNFWIADNLLCVGTDMGTRQQKGNLYMMDRDSGKLIWKVGADPGLPSDVSGDDSLIFVMSHADQLLAVRQKDGSAAWLFETTWQFDPSTLYEDMIEIPRLTSSPLQIDGRVYLAGRDSTVYCLSAGSGTLVWSHRLDHDATTQLCHVGASIAVGTGGLDLVFLDPVHGTVQDTMALDHLPLEGMAASSDRLVFLAGFADARPREVIAVETANGKVIWTRSLEDPDPDAYWYVPRVHLWDSLALVGSTGGMLVAYNLSDGSTAWQHQLEGAIRGIGHQGNLVFVGTFDGVLYALQRL